MTEVINETVHQFKMSTAKFVKNFMVKIFNISMFFLPRFYCEPPCKLLPATPLTFGKS